MINIKGCIFLSQTKNCSPTCRSFKCLKNSAFYRQNNVWCRTTEEVCEVENCTYAMCYKRRLLPKGICGETVKRKTVETKPENVPGRSVKLRVKALRRLRDDDFF